MREVTSEYLEQVQGAGRQFGFQVKVYGNAAEPATLWLGDIISIDVLRSISDKLQLGACLSDKLTLQTSATTLFGGKGKKIEVYYRCTAPVLPWSKLGTFYVDSSVTREGVTAVTAYDMMNRLGKKMSWVDTSKATAPTFPCKMQQMLKYICDRFGFTTDFTCENITVEKAPDGYTAREIISYIAASHGANARFSPSEVLRFSGYTPVDKTIEHGRCFSFDSGENFTVNGLLFSKDDSTKIYIDDSAGEYDEDAEGVVEVFDPFATVAISEYAWGKFGNLSYNAISLEMPAENILEPGDVFTVREADGTERTAIVMEQQLSVSCSDGFVEKISCDAESKNQTRNSENRAEATEKKAEEASKAGDATRLIYQFTMVGKKLLAGAVTASSSGSLKFHDFSDGTEATDKVIGSFEARSGYCMLTWKDSAGNDRYLLDWQPNNGMYVETLSGAALHVNDKMSLIEIFPEGRRKSRKFLVNLQDDSCLIQFQPSSKYSSLNLELKTDGLYYNGKKVLTEE